MSNATESLIVMCQFSPSRSLYGYCIHCGKAQSHSIHAVRHAPKLASGAIRHPNVDAVMQVWEKTKLPVNGWFSKDNAMLALSIILGGTVGIIICAWLVPAILEVRGWTP